MRERNFPAFIFVPWVGMAALEQITNMFCSDEEKLKVWQTLALAGDEHTIEAVRAYMDEIQKETGTRPTIREAVSTSTCVPEFKQLFEKIFKYLFECLNILVHALLFLRSCRYLMAL